MPKRGLKPDIASYSATVGASDKSAQWSLALGLLEELSPQTLVVNVVNYCAAMGVCRKGMHWEGGLGLLQDFSHQA